MRILFKIILFFILSTMLNVNADTKLMQSPDKVIEAFHDSLISVMKNASELGYQGRVKALSTTIPINFNIPLISQVILGRYWSVLDASQKSNFISLYENLITATYADRFNDFDGETFQTHSMEELNRGRILVKTVLTTMNGETISLDYLMSKHDDNWMIISVIANGANDISIKRGEYSDVIKMHGYDELLDQIKNKINEASS